MNYKKGFLDLRKKLHQTSSCLVWFRWYLLGLFVVVLSFSNSSEAQFIGVPAIQNYEVNEYQAGIHNYQITQDKRGVIFIANNLGLLTFDGTNWDLLQVANGTKVRSVYIQADGHVYVGAQNELGYFFPDQQGKYSYQSLKHLIPEEHQNFNDIWRIHEHENRIIFTSSGNLFMLNGEDEQIETLPSSELGHSFILREELLSKFANQPISVLEDNQWQDKFANNFFKDMSVLAVLPNGQDQEIIATQENGLFLQNHDQVAVFSPVYQAELIQYEISAAVQLGNGNYAVGTNSNGLYIFDRQGSLIHHANDQNGLLGRTIISIFEDLEGSIWLGLSNGVSKLNWNYPFSFINESVGLPGTGYSAAFFNGQTYFATNNGVYRSNNGIGPITELERVPEVTGQIYRLQIIGNELIVSANNGAYAIREDEVYTITNEVGWWCFVPTGNPNLLIGGSYVGLALFERSENKWSLKKRYDGFNESSRLLSFQDDILWMSHGYKGVYSFRFNADFEEIEKVDYYGVEQGLPSNLLNNLFDINEEVLFTSEQGVYVFNAQTNRFEPHRALHELIGVDNHILYMASDAEGSIYFIGEQLSGIVSRDRWGEYTLQQNVFNGIEDLLNDDLSNISVLDTDQIAFAASNGFVHFNNNYGMNRMKHPVLIRQIRLTNNDSSIFFGNSLNKSGVSDFSQPPLQAQALDYDQNSLEFRYSMPSFGMRDPEFRYRLIGYQDEWSEWSTSTLKEYTNLREGRYSFQVQGRDLYHNEGRPAEFEVSITPPWYRSVWAYLAYTVGSFLILFQIIQRYNRKHKKEKSRLIESQKEELLQRDNELTHLRNEKLKEQVRYKKRELATSTLHLLEKNQLMNQVKHQVNELIVSENTKTETKTTLRRVVKHIDQNISEDDDWKQFEINFDEVHGDFIKTIRADFPAMTNQEVKLSSYLKMNMTTKEIANLLKISVRGVEIARYRLRKKLGIDKSVNLNDFMMNYGLQESNG